MQSYNTSSSSLRNQLGWMAPAPTAGISVPECGWCQSSSHANAGAIPKELTTVGIVLGKSIFRVHAVNPAGQVAIRKALRRAQVTPLTPRLRAASKPTKSDDYVVLRGSDR